MRYTISKTIPAQNISIGPMPCYCPQPLRSPTADFRSFDPVLGSKTSKLKLLTCDLNILIFET
jgi:hypothetical protein